MPVNDPVNESGLGSRDDDTPAEVAPALRERLDFEALITDISASVVVATPDSIDRALCYALERLRTAVGADRAVFFEYSDDWSTGR